MNFSKRVYYFIFAGLLLIYVSLIITAFCNLKNYTDVNSGFINDVNIILDPGHGGEDGGATANGIIEKDINLSISKALVDIFKASGFSVVSTRNEDKMINTDGVSLRERKVSDMKNRLEMYNKNYNNVILSVHQNMFTQEKFNGTQIFYSPNNSESSILAESIKKSVVSFL